MNKIQQILYAGDTLAIAALTLIGFATHGETGFAFLPRMGALFVPLAISWFLLAPWFRLFDAGITSDLRQLWRPALAMIFASPLAAVLRGFLLNAPVIPIFAAVLAGTSALGMVLWRWIWYGLQKRKLSARNL